MPDSMTVREAAGYLGVSRTKIWTLIKEGSLPAARNPLDKRERLIPLSAIQRLQQEADAGGEPRPCPSTFGMDDGPVVVPSDELEEYMRANWRVS